MNEHGIRQSEAELEQLRQREENRAAVHEREMELRRFEGVEWQSERLRRRYRQQARFDTGEAAA